MFKKWKGFLSGIIFTLIVMVLTSDVFATMMGKSITVYYDNIKVLLNGKEIELKDANGNNVQAFILDDTTYVPIRAVGEAFNKIVDWNHDLKQVNIYETEIDKFWDTLVTVPENYTDPDIYWRHIDYDIMENANSFMDKYGADALFKGLKSTNIYSQYYCINRLVEYYNYDDIRARAVGEIIPFLSSTNNTIKKGAEFALSVLSKKFDSPYIVNAMDGTKIFALFNDYSDYGSYNELWIIKNDKLSKLYSFKDPQTYIDISESMKLSPNSDKIVVQTSSRRSSSFNIIDLNTGKASPEIMKIAIQKVAMDNKDYNNTYPNGEYSWGHSPKWVDNNTVEFEARLSFNYMDIIEEVVVRYNFLDDFLEYKKK